MWFIRHSDDLRDSNRYVCFEKVPDEGIDGLVTATFSEPQMCFFNEGVNLRCDAQIWLLPTSVTGLLSFHALFIIDYFNYSQYL
jgi:hypothetical protein